jgi:photosystem II stability/assembly factor-like uncharacterized protein
MKKMLFVFVIIFFGVLKIYAQQEWYWVNPYPNYGTYASASFTDSDNGTIVGTHGIIRTTDGGDTWKWQVFNKPNNLFSVYFINENLGYSVGQTGVIVKTTNGGNIWIEQSSGTTQNLNSVFFIDANNGIVVGNSGTIRKTTDGGSTWTLQSSGTTQNLNSVFFIDFNNGIAIGNSGTIRETTDGGSTWTSQSSGTTQPLNAVQFVSANIGTIVGGGGLIRRTTDGGSNWTTQNASTTENLQSVFYIDESIGFIAGIGNSLFKTTNGGDTWIIQATLPKVNWKSIKFFNENDGFVICNNSILETSDGGLTWTNHRRISEDVYLNSGDHNAIHLINENSYATISSYVNYRHFFKTTDDGQSWFSNMIASSSTGELLDLHFADDNLGVISCADGKIFITTNGGLNWSLKQSGTIAQLRRISFSSTQFGTIVGQTGIILRSTTSGETWFSQNSGTTNTLYGICFVNDNIGTAVGNNGTILRTTDGGENWIPQSSPLPTTTFLDVSFVDENYGMIVGQNSNILRTTNGGEDWLTSYLGFSNMSIRNIVYTDYNKATLIATIQLLTYIFSTSDGGISWEMQRFIGPGMRDISSFKSSNSLHLAIAGNSGNILKGNQSSVPMNYPPQFISPTPSAGSTLTAYVGTQINFTVTAEDTDAGDNVSLTTSGLPSGSLMNPSLPTSGNPVSSEFSWTPTSGDVGIYNLTFTATDNSSATATRSFSVEVVASNTSPFFVYPTPDEGEVITAYSGSELTFNVSAQDADAGDNVTLTASGLPTGSLMDPNLPTSGNPVSTEFSWTPSTGDVGTFNLTFTATDNSSATATRSFTVEVVELNVSPSFVSPTPECGTTLTVDEGSLISFTISAADANSSDVISLSVNGLPSESTMDPSLPASGNPISSVFSWSPTSTDVGIHTIVFIADDNSNDPVVCSLLVEVTPIPPPPTDYCPLSQGYWKNHSSKWSASALPMMLGTLNSYDQSELLSLFNAAPRGDASIILAHQLMAAKLNVANGSPVPTVVADAISDADAAIGELVIPAGIKAQHPLRATMITLASILDDYNNQLLTPNCVQMLKGVSGEPEPVTEYQLFSNFPNPFNPSTKMSWQIPVDGHQSLKVYDVLGNEVAVLVNEFRSAGRYEIQFDASNLASGIYVYRLQAGSFVETRKMILMK